MVPDKQSRQSHELRTETHTQHTMGHRDLRDADNDHKGIQVSKINRCQTLSLFLDTSTGFKILYQEPDLHGPRVFSSSPCISHNALKKPSPA